jgi:hypothetical protein
MIEIIIGAILGIVITVALEAIAVWFIIIKDK